MDDLKKQLLFIFDQNGRQLYNVLYKIVLRKDIAEELLQEVFVKMLGKPSLLKMKNPVSYVYKTAINLGLNWRRDHFQENKKLQLVAPAAADDADPLSKLIKIDEIRKILDALSLLNTRYRQVIVLRYMEQLSYDEIVESYGKTHHYWRKTSHRAISRLKAILKKDQETNEPWN